MKTTPQLRSQVKQSVRSFQDIPAISKPNSHQAERRKRLALKKAVSRAANPPQPWAGPIRSFTFANDFPDEQPRQIEIHRGAIYWIAADRDNPDTKTIIGIKGAKPVPIFARQADVSEWWRAGFYQNKQGGAK